MITEDPTPDKVAEKLTGGVEDTLLLINMMKDFKMRELKKAKVRLDNFNKFPFTICKYYRSKKSMKWQWR